MPTVGEFIPTFGGAVHTSAERFAAKAGGTPQVQQAAYFELLYGLLVATEWSVGERLQQQGVPPDARDFISRFVRNQVLTDVVQRQMASFSPSAQDVSNAVAGHRNLLDQREQEYRQGVTTSNAPFSQLNAARVLTAVGYNPNDANSLGAATHDVDEAIGSLRLPEAAVYLTQQ